MLKIEFNIPNSPEVVAPAIGARFSAFVASRSLASFTSRGPEGRTECHFDFINVNTMYTFRITSLSTGFYTIC